MGEIGVEPKQRAEDNSSECRGQFCAGEHHTPQYLSNHTFVRSNKLVASLISIADEKVHAKDCLTEKHQEECRGNSKKRQVVLGSNASIEEGAMVIVSKYTFTTNVAMFALYATVKFSTVFAVLGRPQ